MADAELGVNAGQQTLGRPYKVYKFDENTYFMGPSTRPNVRQINY